MLRAICMDIVALYWQAQVDERHDDECRQLEDLEATLPLFEEVVIEALDRELAIHAQAACGSVRVKFRELSKESRSSAAMRAPTHIVSEDGIRAFSDLSSSTIVLEFLSHNSLRVSSLVDDFSELVRERTNSEKSSTNHDARKLL